MPQGRVRSHLRLPDWMILDTAKDKLRSNTERQVKNSVAHTMAMIFNCITENESNLLANPYLNGLVGPPGRG